MKEDINICLNFHDFHGTKAKVRENSKYTINFSCFKDQLNIMEEFNNTPIQHLVNQENTGKITYSITFDDGYRSNLYIAEEMYKRSITGTFFIITDTCKMNRDYLNVADIREMHQMGMEIGSHSCTHRHLNRLNIEEMMKELSESKTILENILSDEVKSIAFPGGHFGSREIKFASQAGYLLKRTCIAGVNKKPLHRGIVKSVTITNKIDLNTFRRILELSPYSIGMVKSREILLSIPKFVYFRFINKTQNIDL